MLREDFGIRQVKGRKLQVLKNIVQATKGTSVKVLEIGSYEGGSALHWSRCISEKRTGSVMCIDPWKPYPSAPVEMQKAIASGDVFRRFKNNIKLAPESVPIDYFVGGAADFVKSRFPKCGGYFDIVFIDGDHTHESVFRDLRIGDLCLRDGGILCGDDFEDAFPGVVSAVQEYFKGREVLASKAIFAMRKDVDGYGWTAP